MIFVLFVCILIFCVPFSCDFFLSTYNIVCNVVSLCNEVKYTILWNSSASVTADDWFEKEWEWTFWYIDLSQIILSLVYVIGSDLKKKKKRWKMVSNEESMSIIVSLVFSSATESLLWLSAYPEKPQIGFF